MLITCPKCRTTYNVPSLVDKPEQKVRCIKCNHVWSPSTDMVDPILLNFSLTDQNEKEPEKALAAPTPAFQDFFKEEEEKSHLTWLKPLYFFGLFCIMASIYLFFFHIPEHSPVTLQTISYETVQKDYKTYLVLQAAAFNNTDKDIQPKTFTAKFVDENEVILTSATLDSPVETLPAHGAQQLTFQIERPPSKTAQVILTLNEMQTP